HAGRQGVWQLMPHPVRAASRSQKAAFYSISQICGAIHIAKILLVNVGVRLYNKADETGS
ncbi:MAG: hypothetical protein LUD18_07505, partial [Lachnospiraceae bacterium]|nr:hypothetical protein [Lachnospiraceae bacterium]